MPQKREEWESIFGELSTTLAPQSPLSVVAVKEDLQGVDLSEWTEKQLLKGSLSITIKYRLRGQYGRLRAAILIGITVCGSNLLTQIERAQVFLDEDISSKKFTQFLKSLRAEASRSDNDDWLFLSQRGCVQFSV